jgi:hypothetical protein
MPLPPVLKLFGRGDGVLIWERCEFIFVLLSVEQVRPEVSLGHAVAA